MIIKRSILLAYFVFFNASQAIANDNLIWFSLTQSQYDYFGDNRSQITPEGYAIGFSRAILPKWQLAISYDQSEGNRRWSEPRDTNREEFKHVDIESRSTAISITRENEAHAITISYSQIDNDDKTTIPFPPTRQTERLSERVINLSYDSFLTSDNWNFSWRLGSQYAKSDIDILQLIDVSPNTRIMTNLEQTSSNAYLDLDFSYLIEQQHFSWSPQLILSWNWELSSNNQQQISVIRNGKPRNSQRIGQRLNHHLRTPDSGSWEFAISFDWHNNWNTSIAYNQSISAETDINNLFIDVSYHF